ncbi:hypothetical protein DB31_0109 [Hyalangium minutum]|uniref:Uncharacterized protein n=1 Tax=Hyalangium minutum TaxID=394096 RepID=A0A085WVY5_9BACT|nr:hypothetical protein DB31_0109 [Hyalangium minutum]
MVDAPRIGAVHTLPAFLHALFAEQLFQAYLDQVAQHDGIVENRSATEPCQYPHGGAFGVGGAS